MGGDLSKPTSKNCRNISKLNEIKRCTLNQLLEAIDYWQRELFSRRTLFVNHFDEILGQLVKDSESHFKDFSGENKSASTIEVFTVFALFSSDSAQSKLKFLFNLFGKGNPRIRKEGIKIAVETIINGTSKVFDVFVPQTNEIYALIDSSFTHTSIQKFEKSEETQDSQNSTTSSNILSIPYAAIWEWYQDNKQVSEYLDAVLSICNKPQTVGQRRASVDTSAVIATSKMIRADLSMNPALNNKTRNALWNFKVKDMIDESWDDNLPAIDIEDTVFKVLELITVSKKTSFAVFKLPSKDEVYSGKSNKKQKSKVYCGILDIDTIVAWFAECIPETITNNSNETKLDNSAKKKTNDRLSVDMSSIMISMNLLGNRNRRDDESSSHNQWNHIGEIFACTTIKEMLENLRAKNELLGFSSEDELVSIHIDEYIYSVMNLFARGHKNVAIRISDASKNKIIHILRDIDMVSFLFQNFNDFFTEIKNIAIENTSLVRSPFTLSFNSNYASAIILLAKNKIESAIILVLLFFFVFLFIKLELL